MASFGRISFTICNVIYADEAYRHVCTFGLRYCSQVIEGFFNINYSSSGAGSLRPKDKEKACLQFVYIGI